MTRAHVTLGRNVRSVCAWTVADRLARACCRFCPIEFGNLAAGIPPFRRRDPDPFGALGSTYEKPVVAEASGIGLPVHVIAMITVECARLLPISIDGIGVREAVPPALPSFGYIVVGNDLLGVTEHSSQRIKRR